MILIFNMRNLLQPLQSGNSVPMSRTVYTLMQNVLSGFMVQKWIETLCLKMLI